MYYDELTNIVKIQVIVLSRNTMLKSYACV